MAHTCMMYVRIRVRAQGVYVCVVCIHGMFVWSHDVRMCVRAQGVVEYSLCFFCLKFVAYSFSFWLPFYVAVVCELLIGGATSFT